MAVEYIEHLFAQYGYFVLFIGLTLEFIALPFPGETTMTYAGYLSYQGIIHWLPAIILSFLGTTFGMTLTYWIGYKAGMPFIHRYGKWLFLSEHKVEKTNHWFNKYGKKLLFIGYFIPGVRHFTGYFSGIIRIPFRTFALYAYSGACFWVIFFIGLGYICGPYWESVFELIVGYAWKIAVALGAFFLVYLLFKKKKQREQGHE